MLKRVAWPLPDARFRGVRPGGTWAWHGCGSSGSVAMLAPLLLQLIHEVLRMRQYGGGDGTAAEMPWQSCGRSRGGGWGGGGDGGVAERARLQSRVGVGDRHRVACVHTSAARRTRVRAGECARMPATLGFSICVVSDREKARTSRGKGGGGVR